ncbi:tributyrin esterase [bacterium]|nr:MAG: tributyrin esterase [bacterium]
MTTKNVSSQSLHEVNTYLRSAANGTPLQLSHAGHLHGLAAGLKHGEVVVEGDAGDYLGVLNAGATIRVTRDTGKYLADNMTLGTVIVEGNAGFGAAQYCYGGSVIIHGDAGDFTGTMNKGAVILVNGDAGDEVGTYMLKGDLVVVGNAGENFANYLIRGTIFLGGECRSLGHNTRLAPLSDDDVARLSGYFAQYGIQADPAKFKKIVAASEKPFYH